MDKAKALTIWLPVIADGVKDLPECKEALEMAIKALENQKSIIDELEKLKAEFEEDRYILLNQTTAIKVIDDRITQLKGDE